MSSHAVGFPSNQKIRENCEDEQCTVYTQYQDELSKVSIQSLPSLPGANTLVNLTLSFND